MGDLGLSRRMNMIKITTTKLGPHLVTISKRRTAMEGGVRPTLECLGDEDHDENFLKPRMVCNVMHKFRV
jgi:hypothetical protein